MIAKKNIVSIVICFFLLPQTPVFAGSLADRIESTYAQWNSFSAGFVQKTYVELLEKQIEEKGKLLVSRGGKFLIEYQGEQERYYVGDGKVLRVFYPKKKQVEVYERLGDLLSEDALLFLGGLDRLRENFDVKETKPLEVMLFPKKTGSRYHKIRLKMGDFSTMVVEEIELFPKSGNHTQYFFQGHEKNRPVPETVFHPSTKGYEIIRVRYQ